MPGPSTERLPEEPQGRKRSRNIRADVFILFFFPEVTFPQDAADVDRKFLPSRSKRGGGSHCITAICTVLHTAEGTQCHFQTLPYCRKPESWAQVGPCALETKDAVITATRRGHPPPSSLVQPGCPLSDRILYSSPP